MKLGEDRAEVLFRRAALAHRLRPPQWTKYTQLGAWCLSIGIATYMVLVYDYGTQEHCFQPLRKRLGKDL
jgi:hypothetical protein